MVCRPKKFGGLGVLCLEPFSRALRLRWLWHKWKTPDKQWNGMPLPITEKHHQLFRASTTISIGKGDKANFWKDKWLGLRSLQELTPELFHIAARKNRTVQDAIREGKWIADLRRKINMHLIQDFVKVYTMVHQVTLFQTMPDDIT